VEFRLRPPPITTSILGPVPILHTVHGDLPHLTLFSNAINWLIQEIIQFAAAAKPAAVSGGDSSHALVVHCCFSTMYHF
jgi:hypothetical protein